MPKCFRWIVVLSLSCLQELPALGDTRVFFSSQDSVERKVERLIDQSRHSLDIALFELRSRTLTNALKRAQARGVSIRLVLDASHRKDDLPQGEFRWLGGRNTGGWGVMHNKFAVFDES